MNGFKRFLISRNFTFLAVFMIFFSILTVALLDRSHPLYLFAIVSAVVIFCLQQYRKHLMKNS
jgi:hypothetical protein